MTPKDNNIPFVDITLGFPRSKNPLYEVVPVGDRQNPVNTLFRFRSVRMQDHNAPKRLLQPLLSIEDESRSATYQRDSLRKKYEEQIPAWLAWHAVRTGRYIDNPDVAINTEQIDTSYDAYLHALDRNIVTPPSGFEGWMMDQGGPDAVKTLIAIAENVFNTSDLSSSDQEAMLSLLTEHDLQRVNPHRVVQTDRFLHDFIQLIHTRAKNLKPEIYQQMLAFQKGTYTMLDLFCCSYRAYPNYDDDDVLTGISEQYTLPAVTATDELRIHPAFPLSQVPLSAESIRLSPRELRSYWIVANAGKIVGPWARAIIDTNTWPNAKY